jgi:hypothetical protein
LITRTDERVEEAMARAKCILPVPAGREQEYVLEA